MFWIIATTIVELLFYIYIQTTYQEHLMSVCPITHVFSFYHLVKVVTSSFLFYKVIVFHLEINKALWGGYLSILFVVIQSLCRVQLFATPWAAAHQASLPFTISRSLFKFMSIELVILSNHLILRCPFLLLPSIIPSIWVYSSELALPIRWPKYWSFNISPSNEYSGLRSTGLISL